MKGIFFSENTWLLLLWIGFGKLVTLTLFTALSKTVLFRRRVVYRIPVPKEQTRLELRSLWMLPTDAVILALLMGTGLIDLAEGSLANNLITVGVIVVWVEIWMYWTHRWMHRVRWMWPVHARHHRSRVPQVLSSISFSVAERVIFYACGWLLFLAAVSWLLPISLVGIVYFYTFYYFSSPVAHMNTELTHPHHSRLLRATLGMIGTSTSHAMHHTRGHRNYGFLTSILDRIHGTYWQDTELLQQRACAGEGLPDLRTRLPEGA